MRCRPTYPPPDLLDRSRLVAWRVTRERRISSATPSTLLNLDPQQLRQAAAQLKAADEAVTARIPEMYAWLLAPVQAAPSEAVTWQAVRLSGTDALAERASKKLRSDHLLVTAYGPTALRPEMDKIPLWRGDHVAIRQLVEDFARYPYLPRLKDPAVLLAAIHAGVARLGWQVDSFAYADGFDESTGRYRGLRTNELVALASSDDPGVLVKPSVASAQLGCERGAQAAAYTPRADATATSARVSDAAFYTGSTAAPAPAPAPTPALTPAPPRRFHGTVDLDATRVGRDAGRIADEVIRAPLRSGGCARHDYIGGGGGDSLRRAGPCGAHRHRKQPHPQVHQRGLRVRVACGRCTGVATGGTARHR